MKLLRFPKDRFHFCTRREAQNIRMKRYSQSVIATPSLYRRIRRIQALKGAMLLLLMTVAPAALRGQSALDGFDPDANGAVRAIAVQTDGKILLGGDFTAIGIDAHSFIARLQPDGSP